MHFPVKKTTQGLGRQQCFWSSLVKMGGLANLKANEKEGGSDSGPMKVEGVAKLKLGGEEIFKDWKILIFPGRFR